MDLRIAEERVATQLLLHLFGNLEETLQTLAPEGWEASQFYQLKHPTVAQRHREALAFYENLKKFVPEDDSPPTIAEIRAEFREQPCYPVDELTELLGECVWNIFSNNHAVIGPQGETYDLGSFRGSGGYIADFINRFYPSDRVSYGYLDFYCAGWLHHHRANLTKVYALLFKRLQEKSCTWVYAFHETHLLNLQQEKQDPGVDPNNYTSAEFLKHEKKSHGSQQGSELFQEGLHDDYQEKKEAAKFRAPPHVVAAYHYVYGKWPKGWLLG